MALKLWTPFGDSDKLLVSENGKILVCDNCPCDDSPGTPSEECPPAYDVPELVATVEAIDGDVDCFVREYTLAKINSNLWFFQDDPNRNPLQSDPPTGVTCGMPGGVDAPAHGTTVYCLQLFCWNRTTFPAHGGYNVVLQKRIKLNFGIFGSSDLIIGYTNVFRSGLYNGNATGENPPICLDPPVVTVYQEDNPLYIEYSNVGIFTFHNQLFNEFGEPIEFAVCSTDFEPDGVCYLVGRVNIVITEP